MLLTYRAIEGVRLRRGAAFVRVPYGRTAFYSGADAVRAGHRTGAPGQMGIQGMGGRLRAIRFFLAAGERSFSVCRNAAARRRISFPERKENRKAAGSRKSGFRMRGLVHKRGCSGDRVRGAVRPDVTEI